MLFLLAYWYLLYIHLILCYSYLPIGLYTPGFVLFLLPIGTCIYIYTPGFVPFLLAYWYLVYIRLVLCYSYLPIDTCIYTSGFVLFLLAYWYNLVYIILVLYYSYLPIAWYLVYIRLFLCYFDKVLFVTGRYISLKGNLVITRHY